jgi:hypothetical protein
MEYVECVCSDMQRLCKKMRTFFVVHLRILTNLFAFLTFMQVTLMMDTTVIEACS